MQLDVFMSDAEIDAMIEVLREKVLEAQANPPMMLIEQEAKAESPQGWQGREALRRPHVGHSLRGDDAWGGEDAGAPATVRDAAVFWKWVDEFMT
jgi:hypothetical protein